MNLRESVKNIFTNIELPRSGSIINHMHKIYEFPNVYFTKITIQEINSIVTLTFEFETISGEQIKLPISIDENFEADNTEVIILNKYLKLELYEY